MALFATALFCDHLHDAAALALAGTLYEIGGRGGKLDGGGVHKEQDSIPDRAVKGSIDMIDWDALEPGLVTIFRALSGVAEVRWSGAVARFPDTTTQAAVDLSVVSVVGVGRDELRYRRPTSGEAEPPTPGLDPWGGVAPALYETALGWREIVIRAKVESALQSPGFAARVYIERIRNRLRWSDVLAELRALGLGFSEVAASIDLSAVRDKRMRSIAAIDIRFNALSEAVNPIGMPGIESATFGVPTT